MKNIRLAAFLVFTVCAFCLPVQAQTKWTYKGDNGAARPNREEITLVITQRPNGYEVNGEFTSYRFTSDRRHCTIRGSYFFVGRRLRGNCVFDDGSKLEVTGFKETGKDAKDAFQVAVGPSGELVAWRDGIKPKTNGSSTESSEESSYPDLAGTWICQTRCPAGGGQGGKPASISQNGRTLTFTNEGGGRSAGEFKGPESVAAKEWGISAAVEDGGKRLSWSNGTVWIKQ